MKILKYIKFIDYYLEIFAKRLSGRSMMDPDSNGEKKLISKIISSSKNDNIVFIDGGANIGEFSLMFNSLCKINNVENYQIFSVEPLPETFKILTKNLVNTKSRTLNFALSDKNKSQDFFYDSTKKCLGQNSLSNHYYLDSKITVNTITLDQLFEDYNLKHVNLLKLDIEGSEYKALMGMKNSLNKKLIDYILFEYNQTWINSEASIEKIFQLSNEYGYKLFRIKKDKLLSISNYSYLLDDFVYCNMLLVKNDVELPLKCVREALPI